MEFSPSNLLLYAVTDRAWVGKKALLDQIEEALRGGVTLLQLREKNLPEEEFLKEAIQVKELCHRYNVPLIINDNVDVAEKSGADGVHVGIEDAPVGEIRRRMGPDFIIGATAKTVEQAVFAERSGADYLGVGAVYPSPTKKNAIRITKEQLLEICSAVSIPAVAIGGITAENLPPLAGSGIAGAAVVSAVFGAENPETAARQLKEILKTIVK